MLISPAHADEQMTPLAEQGNWIAMSHSKSITDPADMCFAASVDGFLLRTDNTDNEVRYANKKWSLPADVSGQLTIKVNGNSYPLNITANTDTMVDAEISTDQLRALIGDMNKAASLTVIAGSAAPVSISLSGSNVAISAYLTCANIPAPTGDAPAGENPFQSAAPSESK